MSVGANLIFFVLVLASANAQTTTVYDPTFFSGPMRKTGQLSAAVTQNWKYFSNGEVVSRPLVLADGTIVIGSTTGNLTRVYPNGTMLFDIYFSGVASSPAVSRDGLTIYFGSMNRNIYAVTTAGVVRWAYSTGLPVVAPPVILDDDRIAVGSTDGNLYCLNADGSLSFSFTTGGEVRGAVTQQRDGSIVFGSADGNLYNLFRNGTRKWAYTSTYEIVSRPLILDTLIVFTTRAKDCCPGTIVALKYDGTFVWWYNTSASVESDAIESPMGDIVVGGGDGRIYAIQIDGQLKWRLPVGGAVNTATVCTGLVVVSTKSKLVIGIDVQGNIFFRHELGKKSSSPPRCATEGSRSGLIYVGADDRYLYSLGYSW